MKTVFLVNNQDGMPVKCFSTFAKAKEFVLDYAFHFEFRELVSITEIEVNGESWGIHHSFDEFER